MEFNSFSCKTKYPLILLHGTGARDGGRRTCWGRISQALADAGAEIFYGHQDAWGTVENNAEMVKETTLAVLSKTGSEKVNIIAISKGGLEARYMISQLDMGDKVASLTTISTPHRGSRTMDFFCQRWRYRPLLKIAAVLINFLAKRRGDKNPDVYNTCHQFTTVYSERFNREVLDDKNVYYQSYASSMKKSYSDMLLFIQHVVVKKFDGESDGLVSVDSAKWGVFRGVITGKGIRGVSHADLRDLRRRGPAGKDVVDVDVGIVGELRGKGF